MSQQNTRSPLMRIINIPGHHHILYYIGRHLPLWEWIPESTIEPDDGSDINGHYVFRPHTVATCLRVCRYWQTTLTPVLWHTYTSDAFKLAPKLAIQHNSKYLKALETHQSHRGFLQLTDLDDLFLTPQQFHSSLRPGFDLREQMILVRTNKDLKTLYWLGEDPRTMMDVNGLVLQRQLLQLIMLKWDGGNGRLVRVLKAISGTIKRLGLYMFNNIHEGDLLLPLPKSASTKTKKPSGTTGQKHDDGREGVVMLPQVEVLTFNIATNRSMGLIDLLRCCPKLTELSVNCSADDISRLIFNIQHYSPHLRKLIIGESVHHPPETIEALIRASRRGMSLKILSVKVSRLTEGITSAIVAHAGKLESLEMTVDDRGPLNLECVLRILVKCTKLKDFMCITCSEISNQSVLKALASQPWGSPVLKRFGMRVNSPGNLSKSDLVMMDHTGAPGRKLDQWDDDEANDRMGLARDMAELKEISRQKPAMGWRVVHEAEGGRSITPHDRRMLRELFCLAADKDHLKIIQWSGFTFKRTTPLAH
ncbi:hypothetical protein BGZ96_006846 [Linnemannia gamsii]|uniref:F-box domain-containing protein n=1 Tax=Linnemannia gamsii TaxID=64522 RepID=A0ABQ7K447_9FUNG|nr:hypothetical protein BGZ96_006846 [Linnemannia gamsii]